MPGHLPTIDFIRQIMADGVVTEDEIISLGTFLNNDRDARKSWPGNAVFEVLRDVFLDGRVESHEIEGLTRILQGIEIICAGETTGETNVTQITPAAPSDLTDFHLPVIGQTVTISPSSQFDSEHRVDLKKHLCDCNDWATTRASFPQNCPARLCKHLVKGFDLAAAANPALNASCDPILLGLLKSCSNTDRGLEAVSHWKRLVTGEVEFLIAWDDDSEWCNVFAMSEKGKTERYAYHLSNKRWSFGVRPSKSGLLRGFFDKRF
jgi:hypothetical protein